MREGYVDAEAAQGRKFNRILSLAILPCIMIHVNTLLPMKFNVSQPRSSERHMIPHVVHMSKLRIVSKSRVMGLYIECHSSGCVLFGRCDRKRYAQHTSDAPR